MGRGRKMRIRGRWVPVVGAAILLGAGAVVAYADTINADGDVLKSGNNVSYTEAANFTQHCSTRGTPVAGVVTVKYNGNGIHFDPGATLTITPTPDAAGTAAGITTSGGTATVPDPWNTNGQTFTSPISTTVPTTVPNGTYVVTVDRSRSRARRARGPTDLPHDRHVQRLGRLPERRPDDLLGRQPLVGKRGRPRRRTSSRSPIRTRRRGASPPAIRAAARAAASPGRRRSTRPRRRAPSRAASRTGRRPRR